MTGHSSNHPAKYKNGWFASDDCSLSIRDHLQEKTRGLETYTGLVNGKFTSVSLPKLYRGFTLEGAGKPIS